MTLDNLKYYVTVIKNDNNVFEAIEIFGPPPESKKFFPLGQTLKEEPSSLVPLIEPEEAVPELVPHVQNLIKQNELKIENSKKNKDLENDRITNSNRRNKNFGGTRKRRRKKINKSRKYVI